MIRSTEISESALELLMQMHKFVSRPCSRSSVAMTTKFWYFPIYRPASTGGRNPLQPLGAPGPARVPLQETLYGGGPERPQGFHTRKPLQPLRTYCGMKWRRTSNKVASGSGTCKQGHSMQASNAPAPIGGQQPETETFDARIECPCDCKAATPKEETLEASIPII